MQLSHEMAPFAHSLQKTDQWMRSLMEHLHTDDPHRAYHALRAALHCLRNQLMPTEVAHLSAQLPMLVRGVFYEGWNPAQAPVKHRGLDHFLDSVGNELQSPTDPDPRTACEAVFALLAEHVTAGELHDIRSMLPKDMQQLWQDAA